MSDGSVLSCVLPKCLPDTLCKIAKFCDVRLRHKRSEVSEGFRLI